MQVKQIENHLMQVQNQYILLLLSYQVILHLHLHDSGHLHLNELHKPISPFQGQIREIRFDQQRLFYVIQDGDNLYILHVCKKGKNKTEKVDKYKSGINKGV